MEPATVHAVLRDRRHWDGARHALAADVDGNLSLARVPGPADGRIDIEVGYPYLREASGLALGPCNAVFVADTEHHRVVYIDGLCDVTSHLPGVSEASSAAGFFHAPRGLGFDNAGLLVADSGNARLQLLAAPRLEPAGAWSHGPNPVSLALDEAGRCYLIDATTRRLTRLLPGGVPDIAFGNEVLAQAVLQQPLHVAVDGDRVFVSDIRANTVFVFSGAGEFLGDLQGPAGWLPGALAADAGRLYAADAATGAIQVFGHEALPQHLGQLQGFRGPVTALALGPAGDLYIKPALDATYYVFPADRAFLPVGEIIAGPFDAGVEQQWERAWAEASIPPGTAVSLAVVVKESPAAPVDADWLEVGTHDVLLPQLTHSNRRHVWLRATLRGTADASPVLRQVRAATVAENLLDYLPMTYGFNDEPSGFLSRWLKLLRGEFQLVEEVLDDMPRLADPSFLPASALPWLAGWLALELPAIADADARRQLVRRAVRLLARRGSPRSIAEFVELHTGIRPVIFEAFEERRIWVLGEGSRLDFDTRLPAFDPNGLVLPDAGSAVVGESGPLAAHSIGMPLYSEEAYRFCVAVDGYRARDEATRREIERIVAREKPAHTDYRIEYIEPLSRVGLQARVGIDFIVGGDPPPLALGSTRLGFDSNLPPADAARVGQVLLDGALVLN